MPRYFDCLAFCYRIILRLYPAELRMHYGDEMTAVFQQSIRDAYGCAGARSVARVAACAFGEFFTVALPRHLMSEWVIATSLSLVITSTVLGSLVGIMTARYPVIHAVIHGCR